LSYQLFHHIAGKILPGSIWNIPETADEVFLTFDDGPEPLITNWVLDLLEQNQAKGTFFCLGKNAEKHPELMEKIRQAGHGIGNHSYSHLNGWKTASDEYLKDVIRGSEFISSKLFRPPYGRVKPDQAKKLNQQGFKLIMWSILAKDYDQSLSVHQMIKNVESRLKPGAIIVFHDSLKASSNLKALLPPVLKAIKEKSLVCSVLPEST